MDFVGESFHSSDWEEEFVMLKEAAMKAVDENLINGSWEERSRVAGTWGESSKRSSREVRWFSVKI